MSDSLQLITALRTQLQGSGAGGVNLIETHISWLLVTSAHAFKIKKPVKLNFADFSTLELRRHFCEEELRLNRRLAPELYLGVEPICGTCARPELSGTGAPIEYAVKMRSFAQEKLFDRMSAAGALDAGLIDSLARLIAQFHQTCPGATADTHWGLVDVISKYVFANFEVAKFFANDHDAAARVAQLREWTIGETQRLAPVFAERKSAEFVRECHGDLHLGNVIAWDGRALPFDALEFNPELRWIDVINEIAFCVMDLKRRGHPEFAARFLNFYLELTGDYDGARLLRYYTVYRAMVRAFVRALRGTQLKTGSSEIVAIHTEVRQYLDLAAQIAQPRQPKLWITYGLSGSGKTYGSQAHVERHEAVRIRSDVERKRLFNIPLDRPTPPARKAEVYAPESTARVYNKIEALATTLLQSGINVIVDATFLCRAERDRFRTLAAGQQAQFAILSFDAPDDELRRRVSERLRTGSDASDADLATLERQLSWREPLAPDELALVEA